MNANRTYGSYRHVQPTERGATGELVVTLKPNAMTVFKRMMPRVDQRAHGTVRLAATEENAALLVWFAHRYPLVPDSLADEAALARLDDRNARRESLLAEMRSPDYVPPKVELALPPRPYQLVPAAMVVATGGLLLADEIGVGKTTSAIVLAATEGSLPMLYVTDTHLPKQVKAEFARFAPDLKVHVLVTGRSHRLDASASNALDLARNVDLHGLAFPDVVVTSYSKLAGWGDWLAQHVRSVVYDEVQELRNGRATDKGAAAGHISDRAMRRLGLSGTPIHNYGGEVFNVMGFLQPGVLGDEHEFMREWCVGKVVHDPDALGEHLKDRGAMLRRTKKDVGRELPEVTETPQHVVHDPRPLDAVADDARHLAETILAGGMTPVEAMRAGGELDWKLREATGLAKVRAGIEWVRMLVESDEKVLLYGWHHGVYDALARGLADLEPAFFTGRETQNQKAESLRRFKDGETPVLVMSLRAGKGIDGLQYVPRARNVVFLELDYSPAVHAQAIGRLSRDGQTDPVSAWYLVTDQGSDPALMDALGLKARQLHGIVDGDSEDTVLFATGDVDRSRTLARRYLESRGIAVPEHAGPTPVAAPDEADPMLSFL